MPSTKRFAKCSGSALCTHSKEKRYCKRWYVVGRRFVFTAEAQRDTTNCGGSALYRQAKSRWIVVGRAFVHSKHKTFLQGLFKVRHMYSRLKRKRTLVGRWRYVHTANSTVTRTVVGPTLWAVANKKALLQGLWWIRTFRHNKRKTELQKEYDAIGTADHGKQKRYYKNWRWVNLHEHGSQKPFCKDCGGSALCTRQISLVETL
jgi:hypothetical protein